MQIFDDIARTETRAKNERESIFRYYNQSARPMIAAVRQLLESWFARFPAEAQKDLRARLRSPIDSQHEAAFWELYLHELFPSMGYYLEAHPTLADTTTHPDFLALRAGVQQFYLEATVAGTPPPGDAAAESRLADVLDLVNKVELRDYFVTVQHRGTPTTAPPTKKLREDLKRWLESLDIGQIDALWRAQRFDELPNLLWTHEGLLLKFEPVPKSPAQRIRTNARPIGMIMGEVEILNTDDDIRDAIDAKGKKYGTLTLPLIVAVAVLGDHCDEIDMFDGLFGKSGLRVTQDANGGLEATSERYGKGAWFDGRSPRNEMVSAVLITCRLNPYTVVDRAPVLIHNPYAKNPLRSEAYSLAQMIPDQETRKMVKKEGKSAREYLRLPAKWPPEID